MTDPFAATHTLVLLTMMIISLALTIYLPLKKKYSATAVISISLMLIFSVDFLLGSGYIYELPLFSSLDQVSRVYVISELGFYPRAIVDDFALYQFVTSTYMHADILHLLFNFIGLIILGTQLEQKIGSMRFLVLYFGSGVVAGAVVLAISPFDILGHSMNTISIGASGCIYGILGGYWFLYPREEIFFPLIILRKWPISLIVLIYGGITALFIIWGTDDEVSHIAHFAGMVGAFPIASLIRPPEEEEKKKIKKNTVKDLKGMARSKKQREILEKALSADEQDVRNAWLEEFFERIKCPKCGNRGMKFDGEKAVCSRCSKKIRP